MRTDLFQRYGAYYDLLYRDKDYEGETDYVARTLRSQHATARSILEFGSGTGRHGRLLASLGFDVIGMERSEEMLAAAERLAQGSCPSGAGSFSCLSGDIASTNLNRAFDAVVSLFHVISYQTRNADLLRTFANAARHLHPGGLFFFDVWHGPAVLHERPSIRVKRVEDPDIRLMRIAEPELDSNAGVVTVRYTILTESKIGGGLKMFEEQHQMRYLFPSEIDLLAWQTGFEVARSEEFLSEKAPSEKTWGVAYLLRKCRSGER